MSETTENRSRLRTRSQRLRIFHELKKAQMELLKQVQAERQRHK